MATPVFKMATVRKGFTVRPAATMLMDITLRLSLNYRTIHTLQLDPATPRELGLGTRRIRHTHLRVLIRLGLTKPPTGTAADR